jgi:hypothetical protein
MQRKSSDEDLFWTLGQIIFKKEKEQIFLRNGDHVAAQDQFKIKKVDIDGEGTIPGRCIRSRPCQVNANKR